MKAYFAYTRVSTVKQGERGSSLQEQKSAIEAYACHMPTCRGTSFRETDIEQSVRELLALFAFDESELKDLRDLAERPFCAQVQKCGFGAVLTSRLASRQTSPTDGSRRSEPQHFPRYSFAGPCSAASTVRAWCWRDLGAERSRIYTVHHFCGLASARVAGGLVGNVQPEGVA